MSDPSPTVLARPARRRKTKKGFKRLYYEYKRHEFICKRRLATLLAKKGIKNLYLSRRCYRLLEKVLRDKDGVLNPYLTWSRRACVTALIQCHEPLPENPTRLACRLALEAADQNRRFPFMKLPTEIRFTIYEILISNQTVTLQQLSKFIPPILYVSRQVRSETTAIFFRKTRFRFCVTKRARFSLEDVSWLKLIGPTNVANMRYISLWMCAFPYNADINLSDTDPSSSMSRRQNQEIDTTIVCRRMGRPREQQPDERKRKEEPEPRLKYMEEGIAQFVQCCGEGTSVRPTIEGLELLARASVGMVVGGSGRLLNEV